MFGTSGIRGPIGDEITASTALNVGRALPSCGYETVVVGRDPRESGQMLTHALTAGIQECGGTVIDIEQAATPTVARQVGWVNADAGVSITASHNPPPDNGLKLWTPSGQAFDSKRRQEITDCIQAEAYEFAAWDNVGEQRADATAVQHHIEAIVAAVATPIDCSVIVDVGNGAGGLTAKALERLGCKVETLNAQPDGSFPGRASEPTAETCQTLQSVVGNTAADFGIAHDGDADRMMAVDEAGEFVSGDVLLTIFAQQAASEGDTVAMPVDTSLAVEDALAADGVQVRRTKVGDVHVAQAASGESVVFGGEPSGAWIWPDETLCPDGPLAACKLAAIVAADGPLSCLQQSVDTYPLRRLSIETPDKQRVMKAVRENVTAAYEPSTVMTLDGIRVTADAGWFLIRASGTQPIVRVTAEAETEEAMNRLAEKAESIVRSAI